MSFVSILFDVRGRVIMVVVVRMGFRDKNHKNNKFEVKPRGKEASDSSPSYLEL